MDPTQFPGQGAPNQVQVAFVDGTLSQITSTPAVTGQDYALDVWAGTQNNIGSASTFSVGLFEGGTQFASFSGTAPVNTYEQIEISGKAPSALGNVEIRLTGNSQTLFDDVRLAAVPEPASMVLIGLGAVALVCRVIGRRRAMAKG